MTMMDSTHAPARERRTSIDDLDAAGNELHGEHLRLAAGGNGKPGFVLTIGTYVGRVPLDVSLEF